MMAAVNCLMTVPDVTGFTAQIAHQCSNVLILVICVVASDFVVAVPSMKLNVTSAGAFAVAIVMHGVAIIVDASVLIVVLELKLALIAMSLCASIAGVNVEVKKPQSAHLLMKGRAMNVDWAWLYKMAWSPTTVVLIQLLPLSSWIISKSWLRRMKNWQARSTI